MRRNAGSWRRDDTADRAAGAAMPRPRVRFACGVAVSIALHGVALLLLNSHRNAAPDTPHAATRMSVRLLMRVAPAATAQPVVVRQAQPTRNVAQNVAPPSVRTEPVEVPVPVAAKVAPPIDGSVFGMPRIGLAGMSTSRSSVSPPPIYPGPNPLAQMQAARDAGRAQIVSALERQVNALQAPVDVSDAACSLQATADAQVSCDSDALRDIVSPQTPTLSGLLVAYRSIDPRASSLAIAYVQGRYRVSLGLAEAH